MKSKEEEKVCEGVLHRCLSCGKQWDDDGCRVTVVSGVAYEVEEFVCSDCEAGKKE